MEINLDKNSATEGLIKITLNEADYQPKVEEKVKEYSRKAQLKGFRPGKVPAGLIRKMYGKSILIEEVNELLSKSVIDYIKQNDIKIIGDPLPVMEKTALIDWDNQKEFEFEYLIGLVEPFSIDYTLKINSYRIELDDKTLQDTLDRLKREYGEYSEPEEYADGDDIFGVWGPAGTEDKTEVWLLQDQLNESEKKKFDGIKKDGTVTLDITKLFRESSNLAKALRKTDEEIQSVSGEYEFRVTRFHRVKNAGMNQEFFDKVFGKDVVKSEEEFMTRLRETVQKNYDHEAEHYTDHRIQDLLLDHTEITVPENFYKKWILAVNKGSVTEEDVSKNYDHYVKELKWSLIFNKVSEDNGIKVEHEDVVARARDLIRAQFAAYGITDSLNANIETMTDNFLKGKEGENYYSTYNRVRSEKVMSILREKLDIIKDPISPADFLKTMEKTNQD